MIYIASFRLYRGASKVIYFTLTFDVDSEYDYYEEYEIMDVARTLSSAELLCVSKKEV